MKRPLSTLAALLLLATSSARAQPGHPLPPAGPGAMFVIVAPQGPRRLPPAFLYDPDMGVPPGYRLANRGHAGWIAAGAVTFGVLWFITAATAGALMVENPENSHPFLFIPAVGPFLQMAEHDNYRGLNSLLVTNGLVQTAGVLMIVRGFVWPQKIVRHESLGAGWSLELQPIATSLAGGAFGGLRGSF